MDVSPFRSAPKTSSPPTASHQVRTSCRPRWNRRCSSATRLTSASCLDRDRCSHVSIRRCVRRSAAPSSFASTRRSVLSSPTSRPGSAEKHEPGDADPATIGVIGTGRIGLALVGHIAKKGFTVLACDADAAKRPDVEARGARWAELSDIARDAEAILIAVGYDRDLRALVADGLIEQLRPGTILAVLSTVEPRTVQELAANGAAAGVQVVDATMCRGGRAAD